MTFDSTVPRDLDAEEAALEAKGWYFQVHDPVRMSRAPGYVPNTLAQAWRGDLRHDHASEKVQGDGDTHDLARAACLDNLYREFGDA